MADITPGDSVNAQPTVNLFGASYDRKLILFPRTVDHFLF